jgi:cob(I)alamin adenosyltransferase
MTASLIQHQPRREPGRSLGPAGRPQAAARSSTSRSLRLVAQQEGLIQIHTAPFRGSFSGVFSQALRSAGLGSRVLITQFLKGGVDQGLEASLWLCGRLQWLRPAVAGCLSEPCATAVPCATAASVVSAAPAAGPSGLAGSPLPTASDPDREAVEAVWAYSRDQLLGGQLDQLVLDELGLAVDLGYLCAAEVTATLERRPSHVDVILTGPAMPAALMAMADQVTQLRRGF